MILNATDIKRDYSFSPPIIWCYGLPAAGKTTLANQIHLILKQLNIPVALLDGDIMRKGLCSDLGFLPQDRTENIRRTAEVAVLLANSGVAVVVACITPLESDRELARHIIGVKKFWDVFVNTDLEVCKRRDPKGHYKKALEGHMLNFTGINAPFEKPCSPRMQVCTEYETPVNSAKSILDAIAIDLRYNYESK